jgi:hypothetical protein
MLEPNAPEKAFEKAKAWWESKTIWGIIIAVVPVIASMFGYDLQSLVVDNVNDTVQTGNSIWNEVITVVGVVVAWWGRVKARTKIG